MKKIEGLIDSTAMDAVAAALAAEGIGGATVTRVAGLGADGHRMSYRGVTYSAPVVQMKLELVVADHEAAALAGVIRQGCAVDPSSRVWISDITTGTTARRYDIAV